MTRARNLADLLDANGDVKSASLDNVPASNDASALTTGTIPNARISLDANEIPNLDTAKITTGTLASARIPNISTDKLTSGTIPDARLPSTALNSNIDLTNLSASNLTSGTIPTARITGLPSGVGGKLLKYAVDFDGAFINLNHTNWVDTALSIAFTPTSATSTIIVRGHVHCYVSGNSGSYHGLMLYKCQKNGSDFGEGFNIYSGYTSNAALINAPFPFLYDDTSGSTSERTYKIQVKNQDTQTGSAHNQYGGKSVLEIFEIGA